MTMTHQEAKPARRAAIRDRALSAQSGAGMAALCLIGFCFAGWCAYVAFTDFARATSYEYGRPQVDSGPAWLFLLAAVVVAVVTFVTMTGLTVVAPNEAQVGTRFGPYVGTLSESGCWWLNPFVSTKRVSLRTRVHENKPIKVNDLNGNPIEFGAVVRWSVEHAAQAILSVEDYKEYMQLQIEAALRSVAAEHPYDTFDAPVADPALAPVVASSARSGQAPLPLRGHGGEIQAILAERLSEACAETGLAVHGVQISHLAYAPEIAGVMLKVQQATALSTARRTILFNALTTVRDALEKLKVSDEHHRSIEFDPVHEAAFVSNLLVTMVSEKELSPVLNLNGLYG